MKPENEWLREWFTREMPLGESSHLTASFECYDVGVIGVHLCDCFIDGVLCDTAIRIINTFGSRTEYDESRTGVYILVRGELPYFDGYRGLPVKAYWLTLETVVYTDIVENSSAFEWFIKEYDLFTQPDSDYMDVKYYRHIEYEDGVLKISMPEIHEGSRHKTLLSYGGKMLASGLEMDMVEVRMYDFNMLYCAPPLPIEEFQGIVESVKKYAKE